MKKLSKKLISLVLTMTMMLSLASVISVSATETAEPEVLLDLNMDSENAAVVALTGAATPTYTAYDGGTDKYFTGKGDYKFMLNDTTSANTTVTIEFEMAVSDRNSGASIWIGDTSKALISWHDYKGDTDGLYRLPKLIANKTSYKIELNLATGEAVYYKGGSQVHTATIAAVVGLETNQIGFSKSADLIYLDNVKVTATQNESTGGDEEEVVTPGALLDLNMDSENAAVVALTGAATPTYTAYDGGTDKYFTGKGDYKFMLNDTTSANTTVTIEFEMAVSDRNSGASIWIGDTSKALISWHDYKGDTDGLYRLPKLIANKTSYKIELNLATGEAVYYKGGSQVHTDTIAAVVGLETNQIGFSKSADLIYLDNVKVTATQNESTGGDEEDVVTPGALLDLNMDSENAAVVALTGAATPTYTAYDGGTDKYFTGKGDYKFILNDTTSANTTVTIEFEMAVSDRNTAATLWIGDTSKVLINWPKFSDGNSSAWNWQPKLIANITQFKVEVNLETGEVVCYKGGSQVHAETIPAFVGLETNQIGFSKGYDNLFLDNVKVTAAKNIPSVTACEGITVSGNTATAVFTLSAAENLTGVEYFLVSYDTNNILVNVTHLPKTYTTPSNDEVTLNLDVSEGYNKIRAFMWTNDLVPIIEDVTYPAN